MSKTDIMCSLWGVFTVYIVPVPKHYDNSNFVARFNNVRN